MRAGECGLDWGFSNENPLKNSTIESNKQALIMCNDSKRDYNCFGNYWTSLDIIYHDQRLQEAFKTFLVCFDALEEALLLAMLPLLSSSVFTMLETFQEPCFFMLFQLRRHLENNWKFKFNYWQSSAHSQQRTLVVIYTLIWLADSTESSWTPWRTLRNV